MLRDARGPWVHISPCTDAASTGVTTTGCRIHPASSCDSRAPALPQSSYSSSRVVARNQWEARHLVKGGNLFH